MSFNTFGKVFRFSTFGESHGPAIGCMVDGAPAGLELCEADIQKYLDERKPGTSRHTTQRRESDTVRILSGVFEGKTTGTPIGLLIENEDQRSKDYGDIAKAYRPGHADMTYIAKYGLRDYRGGGRSSARETAMRVAAGAVARKILPANITISAGLVQIGPHKIDRTRLDWAEARRNALMCPDAVAARDWADYLDSVRKSGNSVGGVVEVVAEGVPAGWGAPIYSKLDADLASAMMSINAVKAVEIGDGMDVASLTGSENADEIVINKETGQPDFLSNHAGGILGGISNGAPIVCRFAVKPTSSILIPRRSVTEDGSETEVITKGRHDPCVGIRAVPVAEAMMAIVLADHMMMHRAQMG